MKSECVYCAVRNEYLNLVRTDILHAFVENVSSLPHSDAVFRTKEKLKDLS